MPSKTERRARKFRRTVPAAMHTTSSANMAVWSPSGSFDTPAKDLSTVKTASRLPW